MNRLIFLLGVLLLAACAPKEDEGGEAGVPVKFSLMLGDGTHVTKTTSALAQTGDDWVFRGITRTVFLPYEDVGAVKAGSARLGYCDPLNSITSSSYNENYSILYNKKWLPRDTRSFLFYGEGYTTLTDKAEAGSLLAEGLDGANTSLICFSPEPIAPEEVSSTVATSLVTYLNKIANTSVNQMSYVQTFKDAYSTEYARFNNGGELMSGSGAGIKVMLDVLYNAIKNKNTDMAKALVSNILASGVSPNEGKNSLVLPEEWANFPGPGLPAGAVALRWNSGAKKFVLGEDTSVKMVPTQRFCYPLSLWYYANSGIRTTTKEDFDPTSVYQTATSSWEDDILPLYEENPGRVRPETTGAVLIDPIRYAVGNVEFTLEHVASSKIKDAKNANVSVNNDKFPLTGIVMGGQFQQDYNFTPKAGSEEYFVYDTYFDGPAYISSTQGDKTLRMLVTDSSLQTVYFAMEFKNNTTSTFTGATGLVLPGGTFYLVGKLDLEKAQESTRREKVFEKGYTTQATVQVKDLKHAYNIIPDLRDPQLQIGLTVAVNWDFSTPTSEEIK